MNALRMTLRVLFFPIWVGWKAYHGLWWAFDNSPARAGVRRTERGTEASEDCAPPGAPSAPADASAKPSVSTFMLKSGYTCTLIASLGSAIGSAVFVDSTPRAWLTWGWLTAWAGVGSVLCLRHVAARHARAQTRTRWQRVQATALGVSDACTAGVDRIAEGAKGVGSFAKSAWGSAPARALREAWAGFQKGRREQRPAASKTAGA